MGGERRLKPEIIAQTERLLLRTEAPATGPSGCSI